MGLDPVALVALVISLVALVATTGQLLQQYFATADGYRQCQPSVMGDWGRKTKLRWRWREFRFETIYFVPKISVQILQKEIVKQSSFESQSGVLLWSAKLQDPDVFYGNEQSVPSSWKNSAVAISGDFETGPSWIHDERRRPNPTTGERVCWISLLASLHESQERLNDIYYIPDIAKYGPNCPMYLNPELWHRGQPPNESEPTAAFTRILQRSWDFMVVDVR